LSWFWSRRGIIGGVGGGGIGGGGPWLRRFGAFYGLI